MQKIILKPGELSLEELRAVWHSFMSVELDPQSHSDIHASSDLVSTLIKNKKSIYGINTGFGKLATKAIPLDQLEDLQKRLVLSHAAGVGVALPDEVVRLILLLKINSLAQGFSGVRLEVIEALIRLYQAQVFPIIPAKGSVGASGDLAPLAHMSAVLLGVGNVRFENKILPAQTALEKIGLKPIRLAPKEGLALLNGTQVSTAIALTALFKLENIFAAAVIAGSLSIDAAAASTVPFDARIQQIRRQTGQIKVAALFRELLKESEINLSHQGCERIQDPYSLRCQAQVMGACFDYLSFVAQKLLLEANGVSDNPVLFSKDQAVLSGGNFHAEPVALAADSMALCFAEVGSISERRTALLTDAQLSGLPAFLVPEPGLNSGFMLAQVTAAALVSENKLLSHPASVDTIPTSANQEDHVSMATHASRRLLDMAENTSHIIAIELLAACQGIDLRRPLKTSKQLQPSFDKIRSKVAFYDQDRFFAPDIEAVKTIIEEGFFKEQVLQTMNDFFEGCG